MPTATYQTRRGEIETYFDRTAADAWKKLTSDAPVSGIRATVRAGRDRMRATLLGWLPEDLAERTLLDAGCGTGSLSFEAARRHAHVTAIDLSPTLVQHARDLRPDDIDPARIDFRAGDMLDPALGRFDHAVFMDSLIHYKTSDMVRVLAGMAERIDRSILFTFAPRTPMLAVMHATGRLFPRSDRAPAIEPVADGRLRRLIAEDPALTGWRIGRTSRIKSGFYTSQALELVHR